MPSALNRSRQLIEARAVIDCESCGDTDLECTARRWLCHAEQSDQPRANLLREALRCLTKEIESDVLVAFVTRAGISDGALERLGHLGRE